MSAEKKSGETTSQMHPKLAELRSFGVTDEDSIQTAFNIYMDLCEVKGWWNVRLHYCEELQEIFMSGRPKRGHTREIILPMKLSAHLTPAYLQDIVRHVSLKDYETAGVILAISGPETTRVYYRITDGLIPPDHPDSSDTMKQEEIRDFDRKRCRRFEYPDVTKKDDERNCTSSVT